jgi:hypothetical protein
VVFSFGDDVLGTYREPRQAVDDLTSGRRFAVALGLDTESLGI